MELGKSQNARFHDSKQVRIKNTILTMNSVRDLSKDKDIIRIIGGMPDRVLDKDAESEGADILDRIYEVHIGTQGTLIKMLQKAGYKVTESDSYTAVIIGERVSENTLKTLPEGCKKIDVFSIASWLVENKIANKKYTFHKELPSNEISEKTVVTGGRKVWAIIAVIVVIVGIIILCPALLLILLFVPGALKVFVR